jgi:sorbitol-specific phosphotransferase system component IIBC
MRPFIALITILLGILVIANHWGKFVSDNSNLLTSHVLGFVCVLSGLNFMSARSADVEEVQARYQEDKHTKF